MMVRRSAPTAPRAPERAASGRVTPTLRHRIARGVAVTATVALVGSGALTACSQSKESDTAASAPTTTAAASTTVPPSTLPEVVSDTTLPGGETSGKVRAPAAETAEAATTTTSPPVENPQPNAQVQLEIAPNFPKSIPLPPAEQTQANTSPPGSPPESGASLVVGQELTAAVGNYESQLKSADWKVTSKVANPEFGELKATRSNAQLIALFTPGETRSKTVIQVIVKGDAG